MKLMKTMKTGSCYLFLGLAMLAGINHAAAQGTAFTYQGQLSDGGSPANGSYDFRFRLAGDPLGSSYAGEPFLTNALRVSNGQFVTAIDFGAVFTGSNYWLEVDVRTNGETSYTMLSPLQAMTPAPYAVFANTASNLSGTLPAGQLSGTVPLANLPAAVLTNNETGVTLGNVTVGGNLTLPATATLASGGNSLVAGLSIDQAAQNVGNVAANALVFGGAIGSVGEGIASRRSGASAYDLEFFTDWTHRMTIANNGNVGIGTTNLPTETLEINGATRLDNNDLYLRAGSDHNHGLGYRETLSGTLYGQFSSGFLNDGPFLYGWTGGALGTAGPETIALQWDRAGDVSVWNNLSVYSGLSVYNGLDIDQEGSNVGNILSNAVVFGATYGQTGEGIASNRNGNNPYDLEFFTGWNNRLTIMHGGNVGINTTTPSLTLEINGDSRIDDHELFLRGGPDQNHALGYRATVAGNPNDGPFLYGWSGGALGTPSPDVVALQWDRTGSVTVNGNLYLNGPLSVPGAGVNTKTTAFIHRVTNESITAGQFQWTSQIDNPVCNGQPNAILIITHNLQADTYAHFFTDPLGVVYGTSSDPHWYILDETQTDLIPGQAFNVLVILP